MQPSLALRMFRPTGRMMKAADQQGSGGLMGKIKSIPPELWPLGVVVSFAVGFAGFSIGRKFMVDKNLRLSRQGPAGRDDHDEHH
ncbi:hypothetical protein VUR80DRAFT_7470 [Thermomyces stellatus]